MKNPLEILFTLAVLAALVWASVRIFHKAGYTGWVVVLSLIPLVNILVYFWFAIEEWPVEKELRRLRADAPNPSPSVSLSEEEAWNLYHEAVGLEVAGRPAEARALFQRIIVTAPNTAAALDAQQNIKASDRNPS